MGELIDFEERGGWIKNIAATRRLAKEFVGPISNKIEVDTAPCEYIAPDQDSA